MSKKTPTPTPDVPPLKEESATCKECGESVKDGGDAVRHVHRHIAERHEKAGGPSLSADDAPVWRNTEAVNAISNAPPYLLSRAETLYVAHCHAMEGEVRVPFPNLRPVERAAWLASAQSTES